MILSNCCNSGCSYQLKSPKLPISSKPFAKVLTTVRAAEEREAVQDLQRRVESYLLVTSKADLTQQGIQQNFKPLLEDSEADQLTLRFAQLDRESIRQVLLQRNDINPAEAEAIPDQKQCAIRSCRIPKPCRSSKISSRNAVAQFRVTCATLAKMN